VSLLLHLRLEQDHEYFDETLGKVQEGACDLFLRFERDRGLYTQQWEPFISLQRAPSSVEVVMRTTLLNVRLYHVFDLLRLLISDQRTGDLGGDAFMLMVFATLNPFASSRKLYDGCPPCLPAATMAGYSDAHSTFYNRWCESSPTSLLDLERLLDPPPTPMPSPLVPMLTPKVIFDRMVRSPHALTWKL
jgi:hypothetical protein